jgi:hypothetical protein
MPQKHAGRAGRERGSGYGHTHRVGLVGHGAPQNLRKKPAPNLKNVATYILLIWQFFITITEYKNLFEGASTL